MAAAGFPLELVTSPPTQLARFRVSGLNFLLVIGP